MDVNEAFRTSSIRSRNYRIYLAKNTVYEDARGANNDNGRLAFMELAGIGAGSLEGIRSFDLQNDLIDKVLSFATARGEGVRASVMQADNSELAGLKLKEVCGGDLVKEWIGYRTLDVIRNNAAMFAHCASFIFSEILKILSRLEFPTVYYDVENNTYGVKTYSVQKLWTGWQAYILTSIGERVPYIQHLTSIPDPDDLQAHMTYRKVVPQYARYIRESLKKFPELAQIPDDKREQYIWYKANELALNDLDKGENSLPSRRKKGKAKKEGENDNDLIRNDIEDQIKLHNMANQRYQQDFSKRDILQPLATTDEYAFDPDYAPIDAKRTDYGTSTRLTRSQAAKLAAQGNAATFDSLPVSNNRYTPEINQELNNFGIPMVESSGLEAVFKKRNNAISKMEQRQANMNKVGLQGIGLLGKRGGLRGIANAKGKKKAAVGAKRGRKSATSTPATSDGGYTSASAASTPSRKSSVGTSDTVNTFTSADLEDDQDGDFSMDEDL
jgi:hypothetical protein